MELDLQSRWKILEGKLRSRFGRSLTLESILFLIGVRELGSPPREFNKEEKVDLMHIAICRLLSESGYYQLSHLDQEGWPHWTLVQALPHADMFSQVNLLREHIIAYFDSEGIFDEN